MNALPAPRGRRVLVTGANGLVGRDLTARYRDNTDWGHWQLAGIVRKLGYERLDNGKSDYEVGYGFNASTVINMFERDKLKLQLAYGEGIGNYFNDGGLDIAPDSSDIDNADATAVTILGIVAYYDHYWNDRWSVPIDSLSHVQASPADLDDARRAGESIAELHVEESADTRLERWKALASSAFAARSRLLADDPPENSPALAEEAPVHRRGQQGPSVGQGVPRRGLGDAAQTATAACQRRAPPSTGTESHGTR